MKSEHKGYKDELRFTSTPLGYSHQDGPTLSSNRAGWLGCRRCLFSGFHETPLSDIVGNVARISSVPSLTTTISKIDTITTRSTSLKISTITPPVISKTITTVLPKLITVTAPGNTKTVTSTTTLYTTTVGTVTESGSSTITVTEVSTSIGTTTIGTSSGYVPLQSQIASQGYTPGKRDLKGYPPFVARGEDSSAPNAANSSSHFLLGVYPTKVLCTQAVQVITTTTMVVTGKKTIATTIKQPTAVVTSTSYITSTVTVFKTSASTTVVATATSTVGTTTISTSYSTFTSTETTTIIGPSATSYAICDDPRNFLHQVNGFNAKFYAPERDPPQFYDYDRKDEVSCCNGCAALGPRCAAGLSLGPIGCYYIGQDAASTTCDPISPAGYFQTGTETVKGDSAIFNTNCGRWRYDITGSDPM